MTSFFGQYSVKLDPQNRIVIPFRLRESLKDKSPLYLSKGFEEQQKYLVIYTNQMWERISGQIIMFRNLKDEVYADRLVRRHLFGATHPLEVDGNNRALIPGDLCVYAGLNKNILLIGMQDVIELWDEDTWNKSSKDEELHKVLSKGAKEGIRLY